MLLLPSGWRMVLRFQPECAPDTELSVREQNISWWLMTPPGRTLGHTPSWLRVAHLKPTYRLTVCSICAFFIMSVCVIFGGIGINTVPYSVSQPSYIYSVKPLKIFQDLQDMKVMLGQPINLQCEIFPGNVAGRWYRNGQLIQPNDRINIVHKNKYVTSVKLWSIVIKFTQMLTNIILFFQGPSSWNCDQHSSWHRGLHFCAWGIFTEPLCQNSHHWYTTYALFIYGHHTK